MAEVTYVKQFLTLLDRYPVKLFSDYVADPRTLPAQPIPIIPRNPHPYPAVSQATQSTTSTTTPSTTTTQQQQQTLTITLKPLRQPPSPITLRNVAPDASIYDVKTRCARRAGYAVEKVKVLWEKKPVADSKTVAEVAGASADAGSSSGEVELGVMYLGSATTSPVSEEEEEKEHQGHVAGGDVVMKDESSSASTAPATTAPVSQSTRGRDVLQTKEFWDDLRNWVSQRVGDDEVAGQVFKGFQETWRTGKNV